MPTTTEKPTTSEKKKKPAASASLQGWPGYRTREGRTGLDPLDSRAEGGHMAGVLLHYLFTGRLRTRNPLVLLAWAVLGLAVVPFILALLEALRGHFLPLSGWVLVSLAALFGVAMLVNLVRNLVRLSRK
jgi:hypothetical protein